MGLMNDGLSGAKPARRWQRWKDDQVMYAEGNAQDVSPASIDSYADDVVALLRW